MSFLAQRHERAAKSHVRALLGAGGLTRLSERAVAVAEWGVTRTAVPWARVRRAGNWGSQPLILMRGEEEEGMSPYGCHSLWASQKSQNLEFGDPHKEASGTHQLLSALSE